MVENPPAMQEMQVQSLGREDPLEEEMVTHSSILAWRMPGTEEPGSNSPWGLKTVQHNLATKQERVRCMERVTWRLTLPYVKYIASGNLLYGSGNSNGLCINLGGVGCGGRWEGDSKGRGYTYTYG